MENFKHLKIAYHLACGRGQGRELLIFRFLRSASSSSKSRSDPKWWLLILMMMAPVCAFAWDTRPTHPYLSGKMVECYNLKFPEPDLVSVDTILRGAVVEDAAKYCYNRAFNHFYDPTAIGPDKIGIPGLYSLGFNDAITWATSPSAQSANVPSGLPTGIYCDNFGGGEPYPYGDLSFPTAIAIYDTDQSRALKNLGAVTHLIEDMAVPAHTRGDPHTEGDSLERLIGFDTYSLDGAVCNPPGLSGANAVAQLQDAMRRLAMIGSQGFFSDSTWAEPTPYLTWTKTGSVVETDGGKYIYALGTLEIPAGIFPGGETYPEHKIGQVSALAPKELAADWLKDPDPDQMKNFLVINRYVALAYYRILGRKAIEFGAAMMDAYFKEVLP